jgi:hypothetical protein
VSTLQVRYQNNGGFIPGRAKRRFYAVLVLAVGPTQNVKLTVRPPLPTADVENDALIPFSVSTRMKLILVGFTRIGVRFPALPDFPRSSGYGTGSTQPREYN